MKKKMKLKIDDLEFNLTPYTEEAGDVMTVGKFIDNILCGGFIDYDGYAHFLVSKDKILYEVEEAIYSIDDNIVEFNKDMTADLITFCNALEVTKVAWFNR